MGTSVLDARNHKNYNTAYHQHRRHLDSLCGQINNTPESMQRDIEYMWRRLDEAVLNNEPTGNVADLLGTIAAYREELDKRQMTTPKIEVATLEEGQTFDELMAKYTVEPPGTWENENGPDGWWAVTNTNGIVAYFGNESYAFAFRSWLVLTEMGHIE